MRKITIYISFAILILCIGCESEEDLYTETEKVSVYQSGVLKKYKLSLERIKSVKVDTSSIIVTFFLTEDDDLFLFDRSVGKILKYNLNGELITETGGIGQGPNEYSKDTVAKMTYCGNGEIYSIDWNRPIIKVHDLDLNLRRELDLTGMPYDVVCVDKASIAVLYSNKYEIDVLNKYGKKNNTIYLNNIVDLGITKEYIFKHFLYTDKGYFFAYYFRPLIITLNKQTKQIDKYDLKPLSDNSTTTAVRSLFNHNNDIHSYYYDLNNRRNKITHVFDKCNGTYKYSYEVPQSFSNYIITSANQIVAREDRFHINFYSYSIDEL
jgi:hypothetical protein